MNPIQTAITIFAVFFVTANAARYGRGGGMGMPGGMMGGMPGGMMGGMPGGMMGGMPGGMMGGMPGGMMGGMPGGMMGGMPGGMMGGKNIVVLPPRKVWRYEKGNQKK